VGLFILVLGLAVFIGVHLVTTQRELRARLVGRLGEGGYKGLYSLAAAIGLALIVYGFALYRATGWIDVWYPPHWTRHVSALLMLFAAVSLVAAYIRGNIKRTLKHPMLVAVKLWALAHLVSNGDLGSILLFGGLLAWAVVDRISLKRRGDPDGPPIPTRGLANDAAAVVVGLALYAGLAFWFHPHIIGVPVFGA